MTSREGGLDQCICLLLHLIWTHMQVGVRVGVRGGRNDAIHNNPKRKNNTAFIVNTLADIIYPRSLFVFNVS